VSRVACALVTLLVLGAAGVAYLLRDPTPRFLERRSRLASWVEGPPERVGDDWLQSVHLVATSGLQVDLLLKRPARDDSAAILPDAAGRRPTFLVLGGYKRGREAAKLIPDTRGAVVAALSYPFRGDVNVRGLAVLRAAPAIRDAVLDTPPALLLAADYLTRRPDVDPTRLEVVGVSFGAPFACIAGALDPRFARVWAIHGSGESFAPLELNMRKAIPVAAARLPLAALANVVIAGPRLAPERWVGGIAPRPFVMINAERDERMPRAAVERLYASAREPKELTWVAGGHVRPTPEVVRGLVDLVFTRALAEDRARRGMLASVERPAPSVERGRAREHLGVRDRASGGTAPTR
jgi:dienelactone hydrolase